MFASGRTVLSMMDEALYIYKTNKRLVKLVDVVPWDAEGFERSVAQTLNTDCDKQPVAILNDMVEQHYRKERVLTSGVSVMDKKGMVDRKLNMAFPNYPTRAALQLKEKITKEAGKMSSDVYIFAAVPNTPQFGKTVSAVNTSLATSKGFGLLPIESSDLVKTLSKKLKSKNDIPPKWVVFVGQHRNGSLRQIVTKDGEIALTRMTPIVDSDKDPQQWASEVLQEFKATMSYLTRFGFQPEEGLEVILVSNPTPAEIISGAIDQRFNFVSMTTSQAAGHLGLSIGPQEDERYADALHIAWMGKKSSFLLPMSSRQLDSVAKPRQLAALGMIALTLSAVFLTYQSCSAFMNTLSIGGEIESTRDQFQRLNRDYQVEVKKKEELGFDIELIQSSVAVFNNFEKKNINMLRFINDVALVLGRDLRVDTIELVGLEEPNASGLAARPTFQQRRLFEATLQFTYPPTTDVIKGNQEVEDLRERLQRRLDGHEVEVTKLLKDYQYVEEITVESGNVAKSDVQQDFVAEIVIKGPLSDG